MNVTEQANIVWNEGADAQSLAENLAGELVVKIGEAIEAKGVAVIALSGGSTPKPLFEALANHDLDWAKVVITLVDERWVPESHSLSNAAFMREHLLAKLPEGVRFVPLYQAAQTVEASFALVLDDYLSTLNSGVDASQVDRSTLSASDQSGQSGNAPDWMNLLAAKPFDVVILGMGGDGHTASFFPDADNVADLVSLAASQPLLTCHSPSTQVERITWSLPMLLNTSFLALHFTGNQKLAVFEQAANGGATTELPIRGAIFQDRTPLNVYYAD